MVLFARVRLVFEDVCVVGGEISDDFDYLLIGVFNFG